MNRLGLVIPAYNVAPALRGLLEQISAQLTDGVQVVVVDDGSADNTLAVARQFESDSIKVLHQDNGGVGSARNRGIEECDAEYIWFVDADDGIMPGAIATLLATIDREPSDCYLFGLIKQRKQFKEQIVNSESSRYDGTQTIADNFDRLFSENLLNPLWNKVFNKDIIERAEIRFSTIPSGEDAEFILRFLSEAESLYVMTDVLYLYKLLSDTSSAHVAHPSFISDHAQMFAALMDYCQKTGAKAASIKARWAAETTMGFRRNIYNGLKKPKTYYAFSKAARKQQTDMDNLLSTLGDYSKIGGVHGLIQRFYFFSFLFIKFRSFHD